MINRTELTKQTNTKMSRQTQKKKKMEKVKSTPLHTETTKRNNVKEDKKKKRTNRYILTRCLTYFIIIIIIIVRILTPSTSSLSLPFTFTYKQKIKTWARSCISDCCHYRHPPFFKYFQNDYYLINVQRIPTNNVPPSLPFTSLSSLRFSPSPSRRNKFFFFF